MSSVVSNEQKPKRVIPKDKHREYQLRYIENNREKYLEVKKKANIKYINKDIEASRKRNRLSQAKYHAKLRLFKAESLRLRNIDLF